MIPIAFYTIDRADISSGEWVREQKNHLAGWQYCIPKDAILEPPVAMGRLSSSTTQQNVSIEDQLDKAVQKKVRDEDFRGAVAVQKDGKILLCKGYGPGNTPDTRFILGSLTKQFTGIAILQLIEKGKLSYGDTLDSVLPDSMLDPLWKNITIIQLLRHETGIAPYGAEDSDLTRNTFFTQKEVLDLVKGKKLAFAPGDRFQYSNTNFFLVGLVIEAITQMSYNDYLQSAIFGPLKMTRTAYNPSIPQDELAKAEIIVNGKIKKEFPLQGAEMSKAFSAGGLFSTVNDLIKWNQALNDEKFLTPAMRKELFATPATEIFQGKGNTARYLAGFQVDPEKQVIGHEGEIPGDNGIIIHSMDISDFIVVLSNNDRELKNREGNRVTSSRSVYDALSSSLLSE